MTLQTRLLVVIFSVFASGPVFADLIVRISSETGDFIGQGQTRTINSTNAQTNTPTTSGGVQFNASNGTDNISITLTARRLLDTALVPGYCYERAQRSSFRDDGRPGVDISLNGRGCNDVMGRFRVRELVFNGPLITSAAFDVVQHCSSTGGPALYANVRFNSGISENTPFLDPVYTATGMLEFTTTGSGVGSTAPGGAATILLDRTTLSASRNFDNGISLAYGGPLPGGVANGSWSLDLAAPGNANIAAANYPVATRYPFQAITEAGLNFSYNSAGSNTLTGSFEIAAVTYDELDSLPVSIDGTFLQNREGNVNNRTNGMFFYAAQFINGGPAPLSIFTSGFEGNETQPTAMALAYPCSAN